MVAKKTAKKSGRRTEAKNFSEAPCQERVRRQSTAGQHNSRVPFGELRNIVADTLERTLLFHSSGAMHGARVKLYEGQHKRMNAEAQAEIIVRAIMYDDGGFPIREHSEDPPLCKECGG